MKTLREEITEMLESGIPHSEWCDMLMHDVPCSCGAIDYIVIDKILSLFKQKMEEVIEKSKPNIPPQNDKEDCMSLDNIRNEAYGWGANDCILSLRKRLEEICK